MMTNKLDDYRVVETISSGRFGQKALVCRVSDRRLFEWRKISYKAMDDALKEMVIYEMNSLKKLRHPNIIHHEDVIIRRDTYSLYLITECGENENLQTLIDSHIRKNELVDEDFIWSTLSQLSQALHSLSLIQDMQSYRSQIFHRCLKPSCVYLSCDGRIKIGDFGMGLLSKPYYQCPEWQKFGLCNEKSDVWSMGCIVYEMCSLQTPFQEVDQNESQITEWKLDELPNAYSYDMTSILKFILTPDDDTRPSALMILHHPILKSRKTSGAPRTKKPLDGVLETDFPVSCTNGSEETFVNASVLDSSDLSLNNYLSMMSSEPVGDHGGGEDDVRSVQSLESGAALPKATSSFIHSPFNMARRPKPDVTTAISSTDERLQEHLQCWARMLEEKELELVHKENRLRLWESQLLDMQRCLSVGPSAGQTIHHQRTNESSGVESASLDSTPSIYPGDSVSIQPTAVHLNPGPTRSLAPQDSRRLVRFQVEKESEIAKNEQNQQFAEHRTRWLEIKKKKHLAPAHQQLLPPELVYAEMEEKAIPAPSVMCRRRATSPCRVAPTAPIRLSNKENCVTAKIGLNDSQTLSSELRAKLKSHNLPGLR